jgi:hypothetical protein
MRLGSQCLRWQRLLDHFDGAILLPLLQALVQQRLLIMQTQLCQQLLHRQAPFFENSSGTMPEARDAHAPGKSAAAT